jgi:15-cis-phytoene synthase
MATAYGATWERNLCSMAQAAFEVTTPRCAAGFTDQALLERAYAHCKEVTAAHGKTFYLASVLLPAEKCRAIRALYAFCRVTDDIVDAPPADGRDPAAELIEWRRTTSSLQLPASELVATAWLDTRMYYEVPCGYADQLIDGIASDLYRSRYDTFDQLATYAYRVASTVGLMSMHIIGLVPGVSRAEAMPYMIRLGVALQLTNILRDVGEDRRVGRVYLPAEELAAYGLAEHDLDRAQVDDRWRAFMRFQIARTRAIYAAGWPGVTMFSTDGRFAVAAACALYSAILDEIEANDYDVFTRRAHVSTWGKLRRLPGIWWRNRQHGPGDRRCKPRQV